MTCSLTPGHSWRRRNETFAQFAMPVEIALDQGRRREELDTDDHWQDVALGPGDSPWRWRIRSTWLSEMVNRGVCRSAQTDKPPCRSNDGVKCGLVCGNLALSV